MSVVKGDKSNIRSIRDLFCLCEIEEYESGNCLRSTFAYVDEDDRVWFGQAPGIRIFDLTIEYIKSRLEKVPDDTIYPWATSTITVLQGNDQGVYSIKRPKLMRLNNSEETKFLPQLFLLEAEILECISNHPHPNLVRYYDCTLKNGRVTGIALEKHPIILQYRYEDDDRDLDVSTVIEGIRAGIAHLHSLSLAHNDLNPTNIALDEVDNPIILDYGSCRTFGAKLVSGGTLNWIDEGYETSSPSHDESAIQRLGEWLLKQQSHRDGPRRANVIS